VAARGPGDGEGNTAAEENQNTHCDHAKSLDGFNLVTGTLGLVLDLSLPESASMERELIRSTEALAVISMARDAKYRWVVVAGRLNEKKGACSGMCVPDVQILVTSFRAVSELMAASGAPHTLWLFSLLPEHEAAVRAEAARYAATVVGVQ
jgi:hypothetical protein